MPEANPGSFIDPSDFAPNSKGSPSVSFIGVETVALGTRGRRSLEGHWKGGLREGCVYVCLCGYGTRRRSAPPPIPPSSPNPLFPPLKEKSGLQHEDSLAGWLSVGSLRVFPPKSPVRSPTAHVFLPPAKGPSLHPVRVDFSFGPWSSPCKALIYTSLKRGTSRGLG